jgi:toxin HigB-1
MQHLGVELEKASGLGKEAVLEPRLGVHLHLQQHDRPIRPAGLCASGPWPMASCNHRAEQDWAHLGNHSAWRNYDHRMIRSFRCPDTERLAQGWVVPRFQAFERVARRKLRQLEIAGRLDDLRIPPGNRLEALRGDRLGQHSIRINDQFRLCFIWSDAGPESVELVDYH